MTGKVEPRKRKGTFRKCISVFGAAAFLVVLAMEGPNACCPDCPGCGNNWVCAEEVLSAISGCCGTGSGTAKCKSDGTFCVKCDGGGTCNCEPKEE